MCKIPRPKTVRQKAKEAVMKVGAGALMIPFYAIAGVIMISLLTLGMASDQYRKIRRKP